jgi:hypothetical protein
MRATGSGAATLPAAEALTWTEASGILALSGPMSTFP